MSLNPDLTLFISDLHLCEDTPELTRLFLIFLEKFAIKGCALYILGDLFEAWLGDDDNRPLAILVRQHLHNLVQDGVKLYIMRGNRDIMMGEKFAQQCGATLLEDPTVIDLYGTRTLLMHGDSLCTLDTKHQRYRKLTLHPKIRSIFLNLPLFIRKKIASFLRKKSKMHQSEKIHKIDMKILDVNPIEIPRILAAYQTTQLIHGHTHKPHIHYINQIENLDSPATRCVLGDWSEELGSVLICTPQGFELQVFSD